MAITYEIDFAAQIARLVTSTEQGAGSVKKMADDIEKASNFAKSALEALGVTLSVNYFKEMIAGAIEAQARMGELAVIAGTTGAAFSKFEEPARTSGTSLDAVAVSVARLSRSIAEAQTQSPEKKNLLEALGIDANDGRDASEVFIDVAKALDALPDKNAAAYVSQQLLGKSYAELRPLMREIAEQGTLNSSMTDEQIKKAKELKDEYERLKMQTDQNIRQVTEGMMPALKDIVSAFKDSKTAGSEFVDLGEFLGTMLKGAASMALTAVDAFYGLGRGIASAAAAIVLAAQGEFKLAAVAWKEGNADVEAHTLATTKRIEALWDNAASHARDAAKDSDKQDTEKPASQGDAAAAAVRKVMEDKQHYQERLLALKGFSDQFAAQIKVGNELASMAYRDGEIGQRQLLETQRKNEDDRLRVQIESMEKQLGLAIKQGDLAKKQELENGIAQATAARQASKTISDARIASLDQELKREAVLKFAEIQRENLTERDKLQDAYLQKKLVIDKAEQTGLYDAAEIARQRELLELQHQARLGDITAQGILARRNFEQLTLQQQASDVFENLANMTAGAAQHNRAMFEINKVANIANAIINTAAGATKALATYPPPISFAMAAAQVAAGMIQVATIRQQEFGSGAGTVPTYSANPNTGFPSTAVAPAPPTSSAPRQQTGVAAAPEAKIKITLVGSSESVRALMKEIAVESSYGAQITVEQG